jgi:hypothetical protein
MSDRNALFRYSKDGGKNWSGWVVRSLGEIGEFKRRVTVTRLGKGLEWVFQVRVTSPVASHLLAASYKLEGSDS